jgi:hypothetical protein
MGTPLGLDRANGTAQFLPDSIGTRTQMLPEFAQASEVATSTSDL